MLVVVVVAPDAEARVTADLAMRASVATAAREAAEAMLVVVRRQCLIQGGNGRRNGSGGGSSCKGSGDGR